MMHERLVVEAARAKRLRMSDEVLKFEIRELKLQLDTGGAMGPMMSHASAFVANGTNH